MARVPTFPLLALTVVALLAGPLAALPENPVEPAPLRGEADREWTHADRALVGYDGAPDTGGALADLTARFGGRVARVDDRLDFLVALVPEPALDAFLDAARALPGVRYAKADGVVVAHHTPNDALYGQQWGPPAIRMPAAWDATLGTPATTVAVLDTGIEYGHPDLAANVCVLGPDYPNGDGDPRDDQGHGTHVAGTVAAVTDNVQGVAGMSQACLMAVKVLDGGGFGSWSDVASGIVWATDNGADVVSMSLGGCPGCNPGAPVSDAVAYADAAGVLVVASAGNAFCSPVGYPAAFPQVIAVGSLDPPAGGARSGFSSCGPEVEVSAPGADVMSTMITSGPLSDPSGYGRLSGTSMAAPHVAGVAALLMSHHPAFDATHVRCVLRTTADDLGATGHDSFTGFGRLNASRAVHAPACVQPLPGAPTLTGTPGDAVAHLTWTAASSFGAPIEAYRVFRGTDPNDLTLLATLGDVLAYDDATALNNVTYTYRVSAASAAGEGPLSNAVAVRPTPPFVDMVAFEGRIRCAVSLGVKIGPCTALPGHAATGRYAIAQSGLRDLLLELVWDPGQGFDLDGPMSESLSWPRSGGGSNSVSAKGTEPGLRLHLRLDDGFATCVEGCDATLAFPLGFGDSVGYGVSVAAPNAAVDRAFTLHVSAFYLSHMPDGWSSLPP